MVSDFEAKRPISQLPIGPEADEMAAHGKGRERAGECIVADRVIGDICAPAPGQPHDGLSEILAGR